MPEPRHITFITGCSSGIGRATALRLAGRGHVVLAGVRREEDGSDLQAEAKVKAAGEIVPFLIDVTQAESIASAQEAVRRHVSESLASDAITGLVNNAGITVTAPLEFLAEADLRRQFEVNFFGVAAVTQAFLPLLARPGGRIVNVSSGAGQIATPLIGAYCASKFALEAMSDCLRVELRQQGIHVSLIEPGFVDSAMHVKNEREAESLSRGLPSEGRRLYGAAIERLRAQNERFSKRAAPPEDVADAIERALTASRPRTRYPVTAEAHALAWLGPFMGDRLRDALFGRMMGL
jgi:NAD(P)-dependent dehydrogenase (short-subunit alcohol dehydrogenase family)